MLKIFRKAEIRLPLAPSILFNDIYSLCVCQEHTLSAHLAGCGESATIQVLQVRQDAYGMRGNTGWEIRKCLTSPDIEAPAT